MASLLEEINRKYVDGNFIHAMIIELTERCPGRCAHCYLLKEPENELDTGEVIGILDQFRDAGVFNLTLTGGDPLLRPDIEEILAAARDRQFFTSVLTSGIPLDEAAADMLAARKVGNVEMTLLGDNAETHDAIMGRPGSFDRILDACRLVRERGLSLVLKTTIMQGNYRELGGMASIAKDLGAHFSGSVTLAPRVDGDPAPLAMALTRDQLATLDPALLFGGLIPGEDHSQGGLLTCRAGNTVAAVSSTGDVFPCILFRRKIGNLRERTLKEIWHDRPDPFLTELRNIRPEEIRTCPECDLRPYCRRCPGVAWLETGRLREPGPSFCEMAEGMAQFSEGKGDEKGQD